MCGKQDKFFEKILQCSKNMPKRTVATWIKSTSVYKLEADTGSPHYLQTFYL